MLSMLNGAVSKRVVVFRPLYCPRDLRHSDPAVIPPGEVVPGQRLCGCDCQGWPPYVRFHEQEPRQRKLGLQSLNMEPP